MGRGRWRLPFGVLIDLLAVASVIQGSAGSIVSGSPYSSAIPAAKDGSPDKVNASSPAPRPSGYNSSASPQSDPSTPMKEGKPDIVHHERPFQVNALSPAYQPSGYNMPASPALPPIKGGPRPFGINVPGPKSRPTVIQPAPALAPIMFAPKPQRTLGTPAISPTHALTPSSQIVQGITPPIAPRASQGQMTESGAPVFMPVEPAPVASPLNKHPQNPSPPLPIVWEINPPRSYLVSAPKSKASVFTPASITVASPPKKAEWNPVVTHPITPRMAPSNILAPIVPSGPPRDPEGKGVASAAPIFMPVAPVSVASPSNKYPQSPPISLPIIRGIFPPSSHQRNVLGNKAPVSRPVGPTVPMAEPPRKSEQNSSVIHPVEPRVALPNSPVTAAPPIPPRDPEGKATSVGAPMFMPDARVPAVPPSNQYQQIPPPPLPIIPRILPPTSHKRNPPENKDPISMPIAPRAPSALPPRKSEGNPPPPKLPDIAVPTVQPIPPRAPEGKAAGMAGAPVPAVPPSNQYPRSPPPPLPIIPRVLPPTSHKREPPENEAPVSMATGPRVPAALPSRKSEGNPLPNLPGAAEPVVRSIPARAPEGNAAGVTDALVPTVPPLSHHPQNPPPPLPNIPRILPPSSHKRNRPENKAPVSMPVGPIVPAALPPTKSEGNAPATHPFRPRVASPNLPVPVAWPPSKLPQNSSAFHSLVPAKPPISLPGPDVVSPTSVPPSNTNWKRNEIPAATPPDDAQNQSSPANHITAIAPSRHTSKRHSNSAPTPLQSFKPLPNRGFHSLSPSPSPLLYRNHPGRNEVNGFAPVPSFQNFIPASRRRDSGKRLHVLSPLNPVSPSSSSYPGSEAHDSPAPSPSQIVPSAETKVPFPLPTIPPPMTPPTSPKVSPSPPFALPPPPPNQDCTSVSCTEPLTNTPPGSPCGCVWPMQVALRLSVELYTFFPLVTELAEEIAAGIFMRQSQIRVMGANAATQQPEKTIVLLDLVPLGKRFDHTTALLTYQRLWQKKVAINASLFGDYEVLYVHYPGLPPSPPMASTDISIVDGGPHAGHDNNGRTVKPLGVDVNRKRHKDGLGGSMIAIIVLSATIAIALCSAIAWIFLFKHRDLVGRAMPSAEALQPSLTRPEDAAGSLFGSVPSSAPLSFGSGIATYAGSAKTFSAIDIGRATDDFDPSRILGEGGFGRVYSGVLEDGTKLAVKVLKRDDQQGTREFLAEVEMLSRLHHRNLVKLIGICIEERARCLVYELIPNGSVDSHLHGVDKEVAPLDWGARIKIALGSARGLAYLHEDSSPPVIHRDFKSSNILLEHDFTPKVSDFGLARAAMDEENRHISTRVMGTFGYVAPEYAMTGHLLVKSDVYSYGVVLLELLTGRKPVDMTQPPGQENLVAWARPLLTSKEGLEAIIDPSLGPDYPFDSMAKVAAVASMCVQPEVSHRPFMGEVVQALKLVCDECEETKEVGSRGQEDLSINMDIRADPLQLRYSVPYNGSEVDPEMGLSASDLFSTSDRVGRHESESFRRHSSSGPLGTGAGSGRKVWQAMRRLARGSVSEHPIMFRSWSGSH